MTVICAKKLECKKNLQDYREKKSPSWPHLSFRTERELSQPPNLTFSWLTFGVKAIKPIVQKYRNIVVENCCKKSQSATVLRAKRATFSFDFCYFSNYSFFWIWGFFDSRDFWIFYFWILGIFGFYFYFSDFSNIAIFRW